MGYLNPKGKIIWENGRLEKKMTSKFTKAVCRNCRIAPICGGGCRQKCLESEGYEGCNLDFTQALIDDLILERFEQSFMST